MNNRSKILLAAIACTICTSLPVLAKDLTIALASEPTSMDPHFFNLGPNNSLASHIFDALVHFDEKQRVQPGLAMSWKPIDDLTWEFKLRKGVKWHDGSPFTADDVVFSMNRAGEVPNSPSSFVTYTKGKTAIKIDELTVHIKTKTPYPLMVTDMTRLYIVSKKHGTNATTTDYNSGKATIGTGPYKFDEYIAGDRIVLQANPNYWGGAPKWDKVTLRPIKKGPSRVAALLSGDVDVIEGVPTADVEELRRNPKVQLSSGISNRVIFLQLDHQRDNSPYVKAIDGSNIKNPLRNLNVRKAISRAINRQAIIDRVMEGKAIAAGQLLPDGFFGVSPNLKPDTYDLASAKKFLEQAGYKNGFQLTLHGPNDRYVNDAKIVEAIGQMLTRLGLKMSIETLPRSVYFTQAAHGGPNKTPKFSFFLVGWGAGTGEATSPLKSLLHTYDGSRGFGAANFGRYSNPELDKLLETALATVDDKKRQDLLAKATETAIRDLGIIPLHYQINTWATKKGVAYTARTDERTTAMMVK